MGVPAQVCLGNVMNLLNLFIWKAFIILIVFLFCFLRLKQMIGLEQ